MFFRSLFKPMGVLPQLPIVPSRSRNLRNALQRARRECFGFRLRRSPPGRLNPGLEVDELGKWMSAHSSIFIHLLREMCSFILMLIHLKMNELRWQDVLIHFKMDELAQKMLIHPSSPIEPQP